MCEEETLHSQHTHTYTVHTFTRFYTLKMHTSRRTTNGTKRTPLQWDPHSHFFSWAKSFFFLLCWIPLFTISLSLSPRFNFLPNHTSPSSLSSSSLSFPSSSSSLYYCRLAPSSPVSLSSHAHTHLTSECATRCAWTCVCRLEDGGAATQFYTAAQPSTGAPLWGECLSRPYPANTLFTRLKLTLRVLKHF